MADAQQNLVRLQDLNFISGGIQSDAMNALVEKERQKLTQEFAQANREITSFFAKMFPQAIDVICSLNRLISRRGKTLFFRNQEVQSAAFTYENCLGVCKEAMEAFPNTVNGMVTALKSRAAVSYIEEISQKLCREFNTVSDIHANLEQLQAESIAHINIRPANAEAVDDTDNFSEEISIPVGKKGAKEISINFNVLRPDAHAVISGGTGTGKSSLLHNLILGGAFKYSPDQLQFWILDFKDGTGFSHFDKLKHVKVMCVRNRPIDALEMMDYIKKEYKRRAEIIKESGGGDITDYNGRAMAENKPLMPRLLIIIDEFTIMPRKCFSGLCNIAKVGRSLGIGFILSSQLVEANSSDYGDAVKQANHFFEFKNRKGDFGKLMRNATDEEEKFVAPGEGYCIYCHGEDRAKLRAAFAGRVSDHNAFMKKINEKWSNYKYVRPIIAGQPERKLESLTKLIPDSQQIRNEFNSLKEVYIPIGQTSTGEQYLYKIDRNNQVLLAFGDDARVASVELSIIEHYKCLSESESAVCYIDLNNNCDRKINAVTAKYGTKSKANSKEVCYVSSDIEAQSVIDEVYQILQARSDKTRPVGNPIELIIHNADRLSALKETDYSKSAKLSITSITKKNIAPPSGDNITLEEFLSGASADTNDTAGQEPQPTSLKKDDIGTIKKLKEIIESGRDNRIYVMLYFEDLGCFDKLQSSLFTINNFKDVLIVPRIPNEYEELSYDEVIGSLKACRLSEQADMFRIDGLEKMEQSDFICAVLVDDKVPHKIIPYEWIAEEN